MRRSWLFFVICLPVLILAGCGPEAETTTTATPAQAATQSPSSQSEPPTVTTTPVSVPTPTSSPTEPPTQTPTATPTEGVMTGQVVDAIARNDAEIQLLQVMDESGRVWQFLTEGPIGIDAAHLLVHKDTNEGVEVVYTTKAGRLFALEVNDLPAVLSTIIPTLSLGTGLNQKPTTIT